LGKIFKFWMTTTLTVVSLIAAGILYVVVVVDPNDYRSEIQAQAIEQGVALEIRGGLAWRFFPKPGINISDIRFSTQSTELGEVSGRIGQASLSGDWLALLGFDIETTEPASLISGISLSNSSLRLSANDALPMEFDDIELNASQISSTGISFPASLSLTGLGGMQASVDLHASLNIADNSLSLKQIRLRLDKLALSGDVDVDLRSSAVKGHLVADAFNLKSQLETLEKRFPELTSPKMASSTAMTAVSFDSRFDIKPLGHSEALSTVSLDGQKFNMDLRVDYSRNLMTFNLSGQQLRLADYLPAAASNSPRNTASNSDNAIFAPLAIPFALWQGQSQAEISLGRIELNGYAISNFYSNIFGNQRVLRVTSLNVDLFDGHIDAIGKLDMRSSTPSFTLQPSMNNINLAIALSALADVQDVTGSLSMNASVQGSGNGITSLLQSLDGTGQLEIIAPTYAKVNIEETFCSAAALFSGNGQGSQIWSEGTQLGDFKGKFQLGNGRLVVEPYATSTGNLSLEGGATLHMIKEFYTVRANMVLAGMTTSSTGCSVNSRLQNRVIPFICKGRLDDQASGNAVSCKPDGDFVKTLLKNTAFEKLGEKLLNNSDSAEGGNPLEDLLKGFLNRKLN
jgi:AsmA protein